MRGKLHPIDGPASFLFAVCFLALHNGHREMPRTPRCKVAPQERSRTAGGRTRVLSAGCRRGSPGPFPRRRRLCLKQGRLPAALPARPHSSQSPLNTARCNSPPKGKAFKVLTAGKRERFSNRPPPPAPQPFCQAHVAREFTRERKERHFKVLTGGETKGRFSNPSIFWKGTHRMYFIRFTRTSVHQLYSNFISCGRPRKGTDESRMGLQYSTDKKLRHQRSSSFF